MKEFGIYTNEEYLFVLTKIEDEELYGILYPIYNFPELTNEEVNSILEDSWDSIMEKNPINVEVCQVPEYFEDYAYLGPMTSFITMDFLKQYVSFTFGKL